MAEVRRGVKMKKVKFSFPFPPSTNTYWRNLNGRTLISKKGRYYSDLVTAIVCSQMQEPTLTGRLAVAVKAYPPDRRRRDLDNLFKSLLDAMGKAGVYEDDSQIDSLSITREEIITGGMVIVELIEGVNNASA